MAIWYDYQCIEFYFVFFVLSSCPYSSLKLNILNYFSGAVSSTGSGLWRTSVFWRLLSLQNLVYWLQILCTVFAYTHHVLRGPSVTVKLTDNILLQIMKLLLSSINNINYGYGWIFDSSLGSNCKLYAHAGADAGVCQLLLKNTLDRLNQLHNL